MLIGFIGAGAMGAPMARNLLAAGHEVRVHTRSPASAAGVVAAGAVWAETVAFACEGAALVFGALPGPVEIEHVARGPGGLLDAMAPGSIYVDVATNAPALVRALCADLADRGIDMLDAPISGGPKGAASRTLAIWVSGREAAYVAVKPVLDVLGDQVRYLGASGAASVAKLVHNCANYGMQMALAEAMTMGVKAGVDPVTLWAAIRQGSLGRQRIVDRMADQFLPGDYDTPSFALKLGHKDVRLATELGREVDVPMRFASLAYAEMTEAMNRGWGAKDSRAPLRLQTERAGIEIKAPKEELQAILKNEPL
jgi:3-hydroxyisobutyrate dehydrogenase-like beta-hydroxyacid dehydrogenase